MDGSLYRVARMLDRHYMASRYPNQWAEVVSALSELKSLFKP